MNKLTKTFCPYGSLMACEFLPQKTTVGGIVLLEKGGPDITDSGVEVQKAVVIAIGPEVRYYQPGDIVLVRNGYFLQNKGQKYAMVPEEETYGCENRDLEPLSKEDQVSLTADKKLKAMIFEECSQIVASVIKAQKR